MNHIDISKINIYKIKNINSEYNDYNFTCFDILKPYINISLIYDILNYSNLIILNNLLRYIKLNWNNIKKQNNIKFKNNNYNTINIQKISESYDHFNNVILQFINNNIIIAIVCVNIIISYFTN